MNQTAEVQSPIMKLFLAWASVAASWFGITTWGEAASFVAFIASSIAAIYTFCLLCEWWWKKVWRPLFVFFGWLNPLPEKLT